jgi:hypothetical protein
MKHIKTYKIFESAELIDRDDMEEILLPLKDIGIEYEIDGEQILGKDFVSFDISKFKVRALNTVPDYMAHIKKDQIYMASFDRRRNAYMVVYPNVFNVGESGETLHASHLEIIGYKWKDIRDEVLHLVSFMLDEGYFFFYNNSIKVSEVINPKGKGLTWMEEDVLNKTAGNEIEMLESLNPEASIAELRISFAKNLK